jgi:hypothetical protein
MSAESTSWYHGGDLKDGQPKGTYLYVHESQKFVGAFAREQTNGRVYRLRPEYHHLVTEHHDGSRRKVIRQVELRQCGGALAVFEEV